MDTKPNGTGKLRKDGTRAQRYVCKSCQKTFSIGEVAKQDSPKSKTWEQKASTLLDEVSW